MSDKIAVLKDILNNYYQYNFAEQQKSKEHIKEILNTEVVLDLNFTFYYDEIHDEITILMWACYIENYNLIKLILKHDIDVNLGIGLLKPLDLLMIDEYHYEELDFDDESKISCIELLLNKGATILTYTEDEDYSDNVDENNPIRTTHLHMLCMFINNYELLKLFVEKCDINSEDDNGDTPLMVISSHLEWILDNYDTEDKSTRCFINNTIMKFIMIILSVPNLLINFQNKNNGNTALHIACKHNLLNLIELLLQYDADTTIKNNSGKTPIELTTSNKIRNLLTTYHIVKQQN